MDKIEKIIEMCELKKLACMLFMQDKDKAIQKFPECILHCEGYDTGCHSYVQGVYGYKKKIRYDKFIAKSIGWSFVEIVLTKNLEQRNER